jgi:ubiquitin-protein ligase
VWHGVYFVK